MAAILLATLGIWGVTPQATSDQAISTRQESTLEPRTPRPFHELTAEVRASLQQESKATLLDQQQTLAVLHLVALYSELVRDHRRMTSPTLERLRMKVRARLVRVKIMTLEKSVRSRSVMRSSSR